MSTTNYTVQVWRKLRAMLLEVAHAKRNKDTDNFRHGRR
jgi:hypothetical protein